jgi:hypothetical protein
MDDRININELMELLNIPDFERIIYHKVEELKYAFQEEISLYKNLKDHFKKTDNGNLLLYENLSPQRKLTYRFELHKTDNDEWTPVKIDPNPPHTPIYDIIPQSIIDHISNFKTDPLRIYKYQSEITESENNHSFQVEFTKLSDEHIVGTIRESDPNEENAPKDNKKKETNVIYINDSFRKERDEDNYKELFYYMQKYPEIKDYIFAEFFIKLKPEFDNKSAVKITSTSD